MADEVADAPGRVRKTAAKSARKAAAKKTAKKAAKKTQLRKSGARKAAAKKAVKKTTRKAAPRKRAKSARKAVVRQPAEIELPEVDLDDDPRRKAWKVKVRGGDWVKAMRAGGYPSTAAAQLGVKRYMDELAAERSKEARAQDMAMAVALYEAIIDQWMEGMQAVIYDPQNEDRHGRPDFDKRAVAAGVVLRARAQLDKIQRLDQAEASGQVRTIVVAGSEEQFVASLRGAVRAAQQPAAIAPPPVPAQVVEIRTADDVPVMPGGAS